MIDPKQSILPPTPNKLKPKHKAFVDAYFRLAMNATDAYAEAYPKASRETARRNGSTLLTNTDIRSEIDRIFSEQVMSPSEVLKRLSDMGKANLLPFIRITDEGFTYFDFSHPDAKNYLKRNAVPNRKHYPPRLLQPRHEKQKLSLPGLKYIPSKNASPVS